MARPGSNRFLSGNCVGSALGVLALGALSTAPRAAFAQVGPGIGNVDCTEEELFQPLAFVDHTYPDDPHGQNVTVMIRGYFVNVYAPDGGAPPGRIGVYDVSDPRTPTEVQYYAGADATPLREEHAMPIGIIDGRHFIAFQTGQGISFWDFTDPLNAASVGEIELPGVTGGDYENVAWQAYWQGKYLYVAGSNQGIYVVDASDPENPELLNQVSVAQTGGFRVGPLFALGDVMVISNMDQSGQYATLDITDPVEPTLLDHSVGGPRMYAIAVGGGHRFYTAGRDGHFLSHSFADKTAITPIAYEVIGGDVLYVAPQDNFLFLGRQLDIAKVDISDEEVPVLAGEGSLGIENPDHGQVTPMGNLVFVGNDHGTGSAFFCHQIGPDTIPLEAQTFYPEDGATVPVDTRITIVFSDFVDLETLSSDSVAIRPVGGEPLEGIFTYQFNQLSFSPHEPLEAETDYEIFLLGDGLRDVMGNGLPEDVTVTFTTERVVTVPEPDPPTMNEGGAGGSEGGEEPEDTSDSTTDSGGCSCSSGAGAPTAGGIGWGLLVALFAWARRRPKWL